VKIILNGAYGRMGRHIAEIAETLPDIEVTAGIDKSTSSHPITFPVYKDPFQITETGDVIIDFSHPSAIPGLVEYAKVKRLPMVIATTGLSEHELDIITEASAHIPILRAANMSLGICLMHELVKRMTEVLGGTFDIEIIEQHHNQKSDSPSGTALALADSINSVLRKPGQLVYGRHGADSRREKDEIGIHAVRGGTVPGIHTVIFAGCDEILEITHTAQSRKVFALGAIHAARYITGKPPGMYDMKDVLQI